MAKRNGCMGVDLDNFTDKSEGTQAAQAGDSKEQLENATRRRFSRNALAGGAVLLSLGNRPAFGGATLGCMSVATINSFDPATNMFISAPAGRPTRNEDLAAEIHRISNSESPFLGTDGHYSTCQDPNSLDGVCLIRGNCP